MGREVEDAREELDDRVAAYEAVSARDAEADLEEFLPARSHPLYRAVLRELVRVDLERGWSCGRPRPLREYQARFPELFERPADVREVAFEEYRLRCQAGEAPTPAEYRAAYGVATDDWPTYSAPREENAQPPRPFSLPGGLGAGLGSWGASHPPAAGLLLDDLEGASPETARLLALAALPTAESAFLSFRLLAELGRGAFGRVYLARQGDLANRLVALKVSVKQATEPQALARLQHTNIVPIYSLHQAGLFQAVCMPYLGPVTLADLLDEWRLRPALPTSGRALVEALRRRQSAFPHVPGGPEGKPALVGAGATIPLRILERLSYVGAILWVGARLADGLAHAHERGVLHRDLKPANVLLSDEGQPMLLDFNLAADMSESAAARVGGTLPYMAPEHLEAFQGHDRTVDARSDLYALGVILYELLTGRLPFGAPQGRPGEVLPQMIAERGRPLFGPRLLNEAVSPAVESILQRLLARDPGRRYQTADELREDLDRHLDDRPLRHAPNRSPRERLGKWCRRHPRFTSPLAAGALLVALVVGLVAVGWWRAYLAEWGRAEQVEGKLADREGQVAGLRKQAVGLREQANLDLRQFREALALLEDRDGEVRAVQALFEAGPLLEEQPGAHLEQCRRALARYKVLEDAAWQERPGFRLLPPSEQDRLRRDVGELLYLLAREPLLRVARAAEISHEAEESALLLPLPAPGRASLGAVRAASDARVREALALNERAAKCFPEGRPACCLLLQRAVATRFLGKKAEYERLATEARKVRPRSTRDFYLSACEHAQLGQFATALPLAEEARRRDPHKFGPWFLLGLCHARLGATAQAEHCYDVGLALRPDWPMVHFNRGLARLELGSWKEAQSDFDAVLAALPALAPAYTHRAQALEGLEKYAEAIQDVTAALRLRPSAELHAYRARLRDLAEKPAGAREDRAFVFSVSPAGADGWVERARLRADKEPLLAIAACKRALEVDARHLAALELLADVLSKQPGHGDEAVRTLDRAVRAYPDAVAPLIARALLQARLGRRKAAHRDVEACRKLDKGPQTLYQAACVYALTSPQDPGDRERALVLLGAAVLGGQGDGMEHDVYLANLRDDRRFEHLVKVIRDGRALAPSPQHRKSP